MASSNPGGGDDGFTILDTGQQANDMNRIDELLLSGKITNAIEYYNYFKNKNHSYNNNLNEVTHFISSPSSSSPNQITSNSTLTTSSSMSSISSSSTTTTIPPQQPSITTNKRLTKKTKNNLSDYANLMQQTNQSQIKHVSSYHNGINNVNSMNKSRYKKNASSTNLVSTANNSQIMFHQNFINLDFK